jgi:hypothetical protein
MAHITAQCTEWAGYRSEVLASMAPPAPVASYLIARAIVGCSPHEPHFSKAVQFMGELDRAAELYWRQRAVL